MKLKQHIASLGGSFKARSALMAAPLMLAATAARAELPTEATAAFATLNGHVTSVLAAVWPILALATGGFVLMKLFKKGANRAV